MADRHRDLRPSSSPRPSLSTRPEAAVTRRVLISGLGQHKPVGRQHPRCLRYQHRADAELPGHRSCVDGSTTAKGHQREIAGIVAALDRHLSDEVAHVRVDDVQNAGGSPEIVKLELGPSGRVP